MKGLGLPIQMLNGINGMQDLHLQPDGTYGIGCADCGGACTEQNIGIRGLLGFGAVSDYDKITVGGNTYTANQLLDKTVIAAKDTKVYSNASGKGTLVATIKAGQPIGKVYSYLKPDSKNTDGRGWLMFEGAYNKPYYAPNEAVSSTGLKDQGTLTVTQELKKEEDAKLKDDSPFEYYLKKYGLTALLVVGGIVVVSGVAKEFIKGSFTKKESSPEPKPEPKPALSGPVRKPAKRKKKTVKTITI
jgi:hypothetical protein